MRDKGKSVLLKTLAEDTFLGLQQVAMCMDNNSEGVFSQSVNEFWPSIKSIENTYSSKMLEAMRTEKLSYYKYIESLGIKYCEFFANNEKCETIACVISDQVERSILRQKELEDTDEKDFDTFLHDYFATSYSLTAKQ